MVSSIPQCPQVKVRGRTQGKVQSVLCIHFATPLQSVFFALFYSVIIWPILRVLLPKYGKMAQWWNNKVTYYRVLKIGLLDNTIQEF